MYSVLPMKSRAFMPSVVLANPVNASPAVQKPNNNAKVVAVAAQVVLAVVLLVALANCLTLCVPPAVFKHRYPLSLTVKNLYTAGLASSNALPVMASLGV
jgi:hypothetical protein